MFKLIAIATTLALLTSCGLQRQVDDLKNRAQQAEANNESAIARMQLLQDQIDAIQLSLFHVNGALNLINANIAAQGSTMQLMDAATQASIAALQAQQASALTQLATLQGYPNIVAIYNPCGAQTAADEVFLKLSNGKYLASFSDSASGMNTRLSMLYDGTFTTSDGTNCIFTVSNGGTVISNEHN